MNDLSQRLAALSPEQRALFESRLKRQGLSAPKPRTISPIPGRETLGWFPTSLDQERLWFVDQMEPGNPAYNIHSSSRLFGRMDPDLMRRAVNASIARHEILRTTFHVVDGRPVQVVAPSLEIELPVIDLQQLPEGEREKAALEAAVAAAAVRFDLEKGPLVRVSLARLGPNDHVLMMVMQHAITDRWSFDIFENEISRMYVSLRDAGAPIELPPLPIQFADFAAWQRDELSGESLERHLAWWRDKLAGAPTVLEIPTDRPRPPVMTFAGARAYIIYPDSVLKGLKQLTQRMGATMFMTTLAALDVLCWKYTGQRDLVIGSAIADRNRPETEPLIGYFLNMLLLRARIDPAMSFAQLLAQVRETAHGAYAHQDVPFASLVAALRPRQDPSRNPLMQVSFIYLDFPDLQTPEYAGLSSAGMEIDNGASRFDLTLACTELPGTGIHSYFEYNSDLYDRAKIERMLLHLGRILEQVAADPERPLSALDLRADQERARDARVSVGPDLAIAQEDRFLHAGVAREAARQPDALAISQDGESTTFAALDAASHAIAIRLAAAGAGPGTFVHVCAQRSSAQAAALLGVLRSGAAYIPLDPGLPPARLASLLAAARPALILVQRSLAGVLPGTDLPIWEIEDVAQAVGADPGSTADPKRVPRAPRPDDLAYVMFTSGSTGVPKGVMVSHGSIANRLRWAQCRYPLESRDRVLATASYAFDIAAWELFGPLAAGATVVLPREGEHKDPAALARLLREARITVAHFVPSLLRPLLEEPALRECSDLRAVFCGGEGMGRDLHDRFFEVLPGRTLAHFYGPTEAAISTLFHDCSSNELPGPIPVGLPIANAAVHLLDLALHPVTEGIPGEIYVGGAALARGYLGRPDLTAERFVPDPAGTKAGARLYRTGDIGKRRADGAILFLGRADRQIKIRGHRIEPEEIEAALARLSGIEQAAVALLGEGEARRLVAYLACPGDLPEESEIRAHLRRSLPEPMVPSAFVVLPSLPLGLNGKIDRKALPEPDRAASRAGSIAPRTDAERVIAGIWETLLRREGVGVEDDFFDLGGDSLLATQVVSRLRAAFEVELPLRRFFEGATIAALAEKVEALLVEKLESMSDEEAERRIASGGIRPEVPR